MVRIITTQKIVRHRFQIITTTEKIRSKIQKDILSLDNLVIHVIRLSVIHYADLDIKLDSRNRESMAEVDKIQDK